jgi:hypothetical protein
VVYEVASDTDSRMGRSHHAQGYGAGRMMKKKSIPGRIAVVLTYMVVIYACAQLFSVFMGEKQPDFYTYYHAVKAHEQGLDPYELQSLRQVSGNDDLTLPFVYPPHCLFLFKPLALLDYGQAYYLFLALKLLALGGLVIIWVRLVPIGKGEWWLLLITILMGYRCAVIRDLRAGNVSIFEQLMLWSGILLLLRHRTIAGGVGIILSSAFKLVSMGLAPLVVVICRSWRSVGIMLTLGLAGILANLASYTAMPEFWGKFVTAAGKLDERGNICPSSLALLRDLADMAGFGATTLYLLYAVLCCLVLGILLWALVVARRSQDPYPLIYLTIFAYVIISPRMKDYSLIIALVPALHTISATCRRRWLAVAGSILLWVPLFDYQSLVLSSLLFGLLVQWIWRGRQRPNNMFALSLNPLRCFTDTDC